MVNEEIQKATNQDRTGYLNKEKTETGNYLILCVTYNKTLPNIKTILEKHWHILNVNPELKEVFENKPLLAFRKNKNLRQLIGGNTIEKNKKLLTTNKFINGKCSPCFSNSRTLCCKQVTKTEHFESNQTNRTFRIFQKTTCKSNFIIYLLECELCKIQDVRKPETAFNIQLNNHRKDVKDPRAIPVDKHFNQTGHSFNLHAKFIITEQTQDTEKTYKEILKERLKTRETFWIKKLKALTPSGLNQDLN